MPEAPDQTYEVICPGCGHLNTRNKDFCDKCVAPLTVHATTDPLGVVYAEGYAARRALTQPTKPIIVIGIWLWMLPLAILSAISALVVIYMFVYGLYTLQIREIVCAILCALPTAVILWISCTLLYRVTRRSLEQSGHIEKENASDSYHQTLDEENEPTACLMCGEAILAGIHRCSACRWSYSDEPVSQPPIGQDREEAK